MCVELVAAVEDKFGLPPDSYGIFDDFGKVKLSRKALMEPAEDDGDGGEEQPRGRRGLSL